MRNQVAMAIGSGALAIDLYLSYRGIQSWPRGLQMTSFIWMLTAMWLAKRSLNRTHQQLVAEEVNPFTQLSGLPLLMFNGGMVLGAAAIVVYFVSK